MPLALSLDEVATRLTGLEPAVALEDPARWAYALREPLALARADVLVVGWDAGMELRALREAAGVADDEGSAPDPEAVVDGLYGATGPLREQPSGAALVALVETLRAMLPGGPDLWVALLGPASLAGALGGGADGAELADLCADQLVDLVRACAEAGARTAILREPAPATGVDGERVRAPLVRAAEHQGVALLPLPGAPAVELVPPATWLLDREAFSAEMSRLRRLADTGTVVLGDGPVPGTLELERFQA